MTSQNRNSTSEPSEPRPWQRDPWGGALVGVGAVALAAGIGFAAASGVQYGRGQSAFEQGEFERLNRNSLSWGIASIVTGSVGAALLVAGAVRYGVVARRRRAQKRNDLRSALLSPLFRACVSSRYGRSRIDPSCAFW